MKNYISIDTLKAYAAGKLYGAELQVVEAYLQENPQERKVVDGLAQYFKDHRLYQWNFRMKMHEIRLLATIRLSQWAQRFQKGVQSLMPSTSVVAWLNPVLGGVCLLSLLVFFLEPRPASPSDTNLTQQEKPCEKSSAKPYTETSENNKQTQPYFTKGENRGKIASSEPTSSQTSKNPEEENRDLNKGENGGYNTPKIIPSIPSPTEPPKGEVVVVDTIKPQPVPPPTQKTSHLTKKATQSGLPAGGDNAKQ